LNLDTEEVKRRTGFAIHKLVYGAVCNSSYLFYTFLLVYCGSA
jgi:hypothetical protein